jgi:hypothetical protein
MRIRKKQEIKLEMCGKQEPISAARDRTSAISQNSMTQPNINPEQQIFLMSQKKIPPGTQEKIAISEYIRFLR